jgi:hypothetical protein
MYPFKIPTAYEMVIFVLISYQFKQVHTLK